MTCTSYYYPTLLRRVQITRETSTNITRYYTRLISPTARKIKNLGKSELWGNEKSLKINLLLDILVCSIAVSVYSSFVF